MGTVTELPTIANGGGLEERLAVAAGQLNAAHARVVELVAEVMATDAWAVDGVRSATHWLTWQLGNSPTEAQRLIGLAAARETHPVISAMFDEGRLSLTQAAVATSVAAHRDGEIAEVATTCTVSQLRLFARAMRNSDRRATPAETQPPRSESCEFSTADDGWMRGRFELDPEHARIVDAALGHARDLLFHDAAADPGVERAVGGNKVTWAAALVEMARRSLDADDIVSRHQRFRVNVFVDPDDDQRAHWTDRNPVPDWLADKLACDGTITPIYTDGARPVSVGRSWRIVPERTRRVVLHRDGGKCRVPWCQRTRWLDIHHLVHWADGGRSDTTNLAAVCNRCHDAIHRGDLHVTGDADQPHGLTYTDHHHRPIDYRSRPRPPDGPPPEPRRPYVHPYGERLSHDDVWVNPPPRNHTAA